MKISNKPISNFAGESLALLGMVFLFIVVVFIKDTHDERVNNFWNNLDVGEIVMIEPYDESDPFVLVSFDREKNIIVLENNHQTAEVPYSSIPSNEKRRIRSGGS